MLNPTVPISLFLFRFDVMNVLYTAAICRNLGHTCLNSELNCLDRRVSYDASVTEMLK